MAETFLLFIAPSRIGGAERYLFRLAQHLGEAGHRVLVVIKHRTELGRELEAAHLPNVEVHPWRTYGKVDPITLARLFRFIRRERVDLINVFSTSAAWIGSLAGRLAGVPVVARIPATDSLTFYRYAHTFVAVSEGVRRYMVEQGIPQDKIHVLYNGVDLHHYRDPMPKEAAKAQLGLPPNARTVGVVASLTQRKGHRFLLDALAQVRPQFGEIHALLAGEGDQEEPLRRQAEERGLAGSVHFLGFRSDVRVILSASDFVALPSLREGLSNALMEAMALRRPVIATSIGGIPEIVREGETGLLVPPGEAEPLAGALTRIFSDPAWAEGMGNKGRALLEERFDQTVCLAEVERYFLHLIAAWKAGRPLSAELPPQPGKSESL